LFRNCAIFRSPGFFAFFPSFIRLVCKSNAAGMLPLPLFSPRLIPIAVATVLRPGLAQADPQRPTWKPIAELLIGSIGEADPVRMSDVMTRCTALNMLFAGLAEDFSTDMSRGYHDEARRMIEHGVLIESNMEQERTGEEADIGALSVVMTERVKGMLKGYSDWFDANLSADGFYINKDIELEMDSCKLASRLVSQL